MQGRASGRPPPCMPGAEDFRPLSHRPIRGLCDCSPQRYTPLDLIFGTLRNTTSSLAYDIMTCMWNSFVWKNCPLIILLMVTFVDFSAVLLCQESGTTAVTQCDKLIYFQRWIVIGVKYVRKVWSTYSQWWTENNLYLPHFQTDLEALVKGSPPPPNESCCILYPVI